MDWRRTGGWGLMQIMIIMIHAELSFLISYKEIYLCIRAASQEYDGDSKHLQTEYLFNNLSRIKISTIPKLYMTGPLLIHPMKNQQCGRRFHAMRSSLAHGHYTHIVYVRTNALPANKYAVHSYALYTVYDQCRWVNISIDFCVHPRQEYICSKPINHAHVPCFVLSCCVYVIVDLPTSFRITSLARCFSHDFPSDNVATLRHLGKLIALFHL